MSATKSSIATFPYCIGVIYLIGNSIWTGQAIVLYTRGCSFGYLAAVAMPLNLKNKNVYVAFNFEANYGLPSNDSYNEWIDRWNLNEGLFGIGNNVTAINGRTSEKWRERSLSFQTYTRTSFYHTFMGYLEHYGMNGTGCLLRTICEMSNDKQFDYQNDLHKLPTTTDYQTPQVTNLIVHNRRNVGQLHRVLKSNMLTTRRLPYTRLNLMDTTSIIVMHMLEDVRKDL